MNKKIRSPESPPDPYGQEIASRLNELGITLDGSSLYALGQSEQEEYSTLVGKMLRLYQDPLINRAKIALTDLQAILSRQSNSGRSSTIFWIFNRPVKQIIISISDFEQLIAEIKIMKPKLLDIKKGLEETLSQLPLLEKKFQTLISRIRELSDLLARAGINQDILLGRLLSLEQSLAQIQSSSLSNKSNLIVYDEFLLQIQNTTLQQAPLFLSNCLSNNVKITSAASAGSIPSNDAAVASSAEIIENRSLCRKVASDEIFKLIDDEGPFIIPSDYDYADPLSCFRESAIYRYLLQAGYVDPDDYGILADRFDGRKIDILFPENSYQIETYELTEEIKISDSRIIPDYFRQNGILLTGWPGTLMYARLKFEKAAPNYLLVTSDNLFSKGRVFCDFDTFTAGMAFHFGALSYSSISIMPWALGLDDNSRVGHEYFKGLRLTGFKRLS